jgi:prepilin-type N-terminal cleavage/methylation domain-containing protein
MTMPRTGTLRGGFTLVELLVSIAVTAMVAASVAATVSAVGVGMQGQDDAAQEVARLARTTCSVRA